MAELEGQIWFASKNKEWRSRRGKYSRILHISVVHGAAYITLGQGKTECFTYKLECWQRCMLYKDLLQKSKPTVSHTRLENGW